MANLETSLLYMNEFNIDHHNPDYYEIELVFIISNLGKIESVFYFAKKFFFSARSEFLCVLLPEDHKLLASLVELTHVSLCHSCDMLSF